MKKDILRLIQDDIKITRLVHALDNVNINCYDYLLNNSTVIFNLLGIVSCERIYEIYNKMIESVAEDDDMDEIALQSLKIYKALLNYELNFTEE